MLGDEGLPEGSSLILSSTRVPTSSEVGGWTISVFCHGGWSRSKASGASWNAKTRSALASMMLSFTNRK